MVISVFTATRSFIRPCPILWEFQLTFHYAALNGHRKSPYSWTAAPVSLLAESFKIYKPMEVSRDVKRIQRRKKEHKTRMQISFRNELACDLEFNGRRRRWPRKNEGKLVSRKQKQIFPQIPSVAASTTFSFHNRRTFLFASFQMGEKRLIEMRQRSTAARLKGEEKLFGMTTFNCNSSTVFPPFAMSLSKFFSAHYC